jgi:hypothetical protein
MFETPDFRFLIQPLIIAALIAITIYFIYRLFIDRCPSCNKYWAKKFSNETTLEENTVFHNMDHNTGKYDSENKPIIVKVPKPFLKTIARKQWHCSNCGFDKWFSNHTTERPTH